jgi:transcriptional regulator
MYKLSDKSGIKVEFSNQEILESASLILDTDTSNKLFKRTGEINLITVYIKK